MVRRTALIALALALWPAAAADARRVTLKIYPESSIGTVGPSLHEARVRISLPDQGRVVYDFHSRVWIGAADGDGCRLRVALYSQAYAQRNGEIESEPARERYVRGGVAFAVARPALAEAHVVAAYARFTLPDRYEPDRFVYVRVFAERGPRRCERALRGRAPAVLSAMLRTLALDAPRRPCDASGTTVIATPRVRIYEERDTLIACGRSTRHRFTLGPTPKKQDCSPDVCYVDQPVVAGRLVAYAVEFAGRRDSASHIVVRDGLTEREVRTVETGPQCVGDDRYQTGPVRDLVLRADGALAWIAEESCVHPRAIFSVRTPAGVLAQGPGIDPTSLVLDGGAIRWTQDGAAHSAPLTAVSPD